ncbi:MAG TPA: STM3941 family protein [Pyrinomonadaceae bacterium]|nr:STM3941 family protein [Pyrinomonadaceae bacterium]
MNEVAIYPKKLKLLALAIGALVFIILGFYFAQNRVAMRLPLRAVVITAYVGIPFFGLCLVYAIYRLVTPKPAVVISDEGLFDNASFVGAGMLKWEEIADIFAYDFMGQRMLGIIPVDEKVVLARQSGLKRVMARMNKGIAPAPFNIPQNVLPISVDELLSMVEERRRSAGGR